MLYLYDYSSTLSMHSLTFMFVTASRETLTINKIFIINFCVGIMRYLNRIFINNWQPNINLNNTYKLRFHVTESILCLSLSRTIYITESILCLPLSRTIYITESIVCLPLSRTIYITESIVCLHVTKPLTV